MTRPFKQAVKEDRFIYYNKEEKRWELRRWIQNPDAPWVWTMKTVAVGHSPLRCFLEIPEVLNVKCNTSFKITIRMGE